MYVNSETNKGTSMKINMFYAILEQTNSGQKLHIIIRLFLKVLPTFSVNVKLFPYSEPVKKKLYNFKNCLKITIISAHINQIEWFPT